MRLRTKTLLIVGATLLGLTLLLELVARTLVMAGFDAIERGAGHENLERARRALSEELASLQDTTHDYAAWDESYRFVAERNPDYLVRQLPTEDQAQLRVTVVALLDLRGDVIHERLLDFANRKQQPLPPSLARAFEDDRLVFHDPTARTGRAGLLVLPEGEWIVAISPILDNRQIGPARGTLMMARPFDADTSRALAARTQLDVEFRRLDAAAASGQQSAEVVRPLSPEQIAGEAVLNDIHGAPALLLTVRMPRAIHQRALATMRYFTASLLIVGLIFAGAILGLIQTVVLSRVQRLAAGLHLAREHQDLAQRVDAAGRDELSELAGSINLLLQAVETSQRELRESREGYRQLFYGNPHPMWVYDPAILRVLDVNDAALAQYGYTREEFLSMAITTLHHEEDHAKLLATVSDGTPELRHAGIWRHRRKDGSVFHAEIVSNSLLFAGGPARLVLALEVTGRLAAEQALRDSEERYALAAQAANDGLWDWDVATGAAYFSPRWKAMLGYAESEIEPTADAWLMRVHAEDLDPLQAKLDTAASHTHAEHEHRLLHKDGGYRHVLSRWVTLRGKDGAVQRRVGSLSDITARKEAESRLRRDALYDALTGLPNRTLLMDRLRQALARARRHPEQVCGLLFLDVDRFKVVNDSLGHGVGDQLLCEVARRIERSVRPEDTVARLGGDEFTVLLEGIRGPKDATHAAERIQSGISRVFRLGDTEVFGSVSIGIAISAGEYQKAEELIRDADTAMYRAKASGKARHELFDSRMHAQAMAMLNLENDLRRALERSEFEMHYQPIVQLEHPDIVGFEALVRWRHPSRGLVLPGEFIPIAEETGLIVPIGRWVLERACEDARRWQRDFPREPPLTLSVNLSARQLVETDLLDAVEEILKRTAFDPSSLHLEITESVIMQRPDLVTVVLSRLKELGIRVSIDDFGTGYSSLSYLHLFPVDCLKIDRSFVSTMQALGKQRRIVETILMLARNLGIDVIAEGVEGEEQREALHGLGCGLAQGYYFSRPVDEKSVRRLLAGGPELLGTASASPST